MNFLSKKLNKGRKTNITVFCHQSQINTVRVNHIITQPRTLFLQEAKGNITSFDIDVKYKKRNWPMNDPIITTP